MRYVDASDQQRLKEFVEESAKAIAPPRWPEMKWRFGMIWVSHVTLQRIEMNSNNDRLAISDDVWAFLRRFFRSIHLQMRDSGGISFNAELFHVSVPSLTSEDYEHLIGINQENVPTPQKEAAPSVAYGPPLQVHPLKIDRPLTHHCARSRDKPLVPGE